jgi:hypothetical protein
MTARLGLEIVYDRCVDDELLAPRLSAPPRTSPLAVRVIVSAAVVVSSTLAGCACVGEAPPRNDAGPMLDTSVGLDSGGEGIPDIGTPQPDAGIDMAFPGELPSLPPDTSPTDAGSSNS